MDIAAMGTALSNVQLGTQVGVAVMKLGKDQAEQAGGQLIQDLRQMELSVNPNLGQNIDIRV